MIFNERVTSITQDQFVPTVVDQILDSNVFMARTFMRDVKRWNGETLRIPIQVSKSTSGGSFSGVDVFDTTAQNNTQRLSFEPKGYYQSIVIPGIEKAVNATTAQVLNLVKVSLEIAKNSMCDGVGTTLYGVGAGDDFEGLGNIVDDGTATSTYGTLSRTTYSVLNATNTASGGTLTLALMAGLVRGTSAASSSRQAFTMGLSNETVWDLYESLLTPTVQANYSANGYGQVTAYSKPGVTVKGEDALKGAQGFNAVSYRGRPIVADEKADAQTLFFLNENYINWYSLKDRDLNDVPAASNIDGVYSDSKTQPIQLKPFQMPTAQYAEVAQLIMLGNLISSQPRRQGKLTGITTAQEGKIMIREITVQGVRETSSTQQESLGAIARTDDGREYRYVKNGGTALVAGTLVVPGDVVANHTNIAVAAAAAAGATKVTVTLGATAATANQYKDGFMTVNDAAGEGISYKIAGHPAAASAGSLVIRLEEPLKVALTTSSEVSLESPFGSVQVAPTDQLDAPLGVPNVAVAANNYGWVQTKGICSVLADEAVAKGTVVTTGTGVAGAVEAADLLGEHRVGIAHEALVDTEHRAVFLTIVQA